MALTPLTTGLVRHHLATEGNHPLPPARPGITWVIAHNGIFKRGVSAELDLLILVGLSWPVPGLVDVQPHVRFRPWATRLAGSLLRPLLANAQQALDGRVVVRPVEKQYFFVADDQRGLRVIAPRAQFGTPGSLAYMVPEGERILCDIHSHHGMDAYFSRTDDRDDMGLSVSVVIGRIYTEPQIAVRLNVWGHRYRVPALAIFDRIDPFMDTYGAPHANAED